MKGGGGYHSLLLASVGRGFLSVGCGVALGDGDKAVEVSGTSAILPIN
jgi:hypothetical protein